MSTKNPSHIDQKIAKLMSTKKILVDIGKKIALAIIDEKTLVDIDKKK